MILSRTKPGNAKDGAYMKDKLAKQEIPSVDEFLEKRDFTGALTVLEFKRDNGTGGADIDLWVAYVSFHLGDYKKASEEYQKILQKNRSQLKVYAYLACCYFFMGMYKEALEAVNNAPDCHLKLRIMFHCANKLGDEKRVVLLYEELSESAEDKISFAAFKYLRNSYQSAIDTCKAVMISNRRYHALNVYVAICYYKIDYLDVSHEILSIYLQQYPDSATAINLKACINFRLYDGRAAEAELKALKNLSSPSFSYARDIIKHNLVVFRNGEGALQILPPLIGVLPEARLNLIIYHLKKGEIQPAYEYSKDIEPTVPHDYILKGIVHTLLGYENGQVEYLTIAQKFFQTIGTSASEVDTVIGRQCLASCFFLLRQFEDVLEYLDSIKAFYSNDDTFHFNYAQAKAAIGCYKEAQETFLQIKSEKLRQDYTYLSWLARCYIMNKQAKSAWELYLRMDTSAESFSFLQLIANDCYKTGQFYYSAKAFDVLERLDPNPEYWEGKRGACMGLFMLIIDNKEPKDKLREIITLLRGTSNIQTEHLIRGIRKWAKDNGFLV